MTDTPTPDSSPLARRLAGNSKGGTAGGLVGVQGLEPDLIKVDTHQGRQRLVVALLEALVQGRASANVVEVCRKLIETATDDRVAELEDVLDRAMTRIEQLEQQLGVRRR
jgi:hypothetical protein